MFSFVHQVFSMVTGSFTSSGSVSQGVCVNVLICDTFNFEYRRCICSSFSLSCTVAFWSRILPFSINFMPHMLSVVTGFMRDFVLVWSNPLRLARPRWSNYISAHVPRVREEVMNIVYKVLSKAINNTWRSFQRQIHMDWCTLSGRPLPWTCASSNSFIIGLDKYICWPKCTLWG